MYRVSRVCCALTALLVLLCAGESHATVENLTGLPAYPNLSSAAMDPQYRTEALGRWCARFTGTTSDSLLAVEDWYRRALLRASETDLAHDRQFGSSLTGIKLALGVDYVAVYRLDTQQTFIELHRCHWTS